MRKFLNRLAIGAEIFHEWKPPQIVCSPKPFEPAKDSTFNFSSEYSFPWAEAEKGETE